MRKRIAKKKIPYGVYCYGVGRDGKVIFCPHWHSFGETCGCKYLRILDTDKETLLWDHCKECGVRETVPPRVIKRYIANEKLSPADYVKFRKQEDGSKDLSCS